MIEIKMLSAANITYSIILMEHTVTWLSIFCHYYFMNALKSANYSSTYIACLRNNADRSAMFGGYIYMTIECLPSHSRLLKPEQSQTE